jgi:acyl carrier protein
LDAERKAEIREELRAIIARIGELDANEIEGDSHFIEDLEIDSLMALEILVAIEKKYEIDIPDEELVKFTTLDSVMAVVDDYLGS